MKTCERPPDSELSDMGKVKLHKFRGIDSNSSIDTPV